MTDGISKLKNSACRLFLALIFLSLLTVPFSVYAACTRNLPAVHFTPTSGVMGANASKVYDVTITNYDREDTPGDCGSSTFSLSFTEPQKGASFGATTLGSASTGALAVGGRYHTTLTVTTNVAITEGHTLLAIVNATDTVPANHPLPGRGSVWTKASNFRGSGMLLKRAEEETCHACHRTDRNTRPSDPEWATVVKSHNSANLGSTKWSTVGWGIAGGKYGEFGCTTCHTGHNTKNIYLIKELMDTPDGSNWGSTGSRWLTIDFRYKTGTPGVTPGTMGDDTNTHATSVRVCEVCHSQTGYHRYNWVTTSHGNASECTSCHTHKVAFTGGGACDSCHGAPPGYGTDNNAPARFAASHAQHFDGTAGGASYTATAIRSSSTAYVIDCGRCHNAGGTNTHNTAQASPPPIAVLVTLRPWETFVRGANWMTNAGPPGSKVFYNYDSRCSNVYCHGNFPGSGIASNVPVWGSSATGACGTCHNATQPLPPAGGSHSAHISTIGGVMLSCSKCHKGTVAAGFSPVSNMSLHVNERVDWNLDASDNRISTIGQYRGAWASTGGWGITGGPYGTCSSIYCHSTSQASNGTWPPSWATPTWGNAGSGACGTCHLNATIASGSHLQHVSTIAGTGYGYTNCTAYCHSGAGDGTYKHADRNIDVVVSPTYGGSYSQLASNVPGTGYGSCTSVYCHSTGTAAPAYSTPWWGTATTGNCGTCHGVNSITVPASALHAQHVGTIAGNKIACSRCHNTVVTPTSSSDGVSTIASTSLHVNQVRNVAFDSWNTSGTYGANCQSLYCHSDGTGATGQTGDTRPLVWKTATWSGSLDCGGCHGTGSTPAGWPTYTSGAPKANSHSAHPNDCTLCHSATVSSQSTIATQANHVNKVYNVAQKAGINTFSYWYSNTGGACTNISCHGNGGGKWGGGALLCNTCHAASNALMGNHNIHFEWATIATTAFKSAWSSTTATSYRFSCGVCHDDAQTTHAGGDVQANIQTAEVKFDSAITVGGSYRADTVAWVTPDQGGRRYTAGWGSNACSTTYCHSQGRSATTPFGGGPNVTNFRWVGPFSTLSCSGCHSTTAWNTSRHMVHANTAAGSYAYSCERCHNTTTTNGTTIADKTRHVNKTKDVAFNSWNPQGTIVNNTCQQLYCHSQGTGWTSNNGDARPLAWRTVESWNTVLTCGGCHGSDATGRPSYTSYSPKANSHVPHLAYTCDACHVATTSNGTAITSIGRHVNRFYDMQWKTSSTAYGTFAYAWSTAGGSCTSIQCHNGTSARWGSSGSASMDCLGCHGSSKTKTLGAGGTIRKVVGSGGDFDMSISAATLQSTPASRHLYRATLITNWDCTVCHAEGWATNASKSGNPNHNDAGGLIHLRNVDTINEAAGWTVDNKRWGSNTTDYANLDNFCLTCHDADGARVIWVNPTNNGMVWGGAWSTRALVPFNTTDWTTQTVAGATNYIISGTTELAGAPRNRVIDVKTQFNPGSGGSGTGYNGNPSQHAVIGARYSQKNASWGSLAWSTLRLKKMGTILRQVRETAILSCADCHVLDSGKGAHGGAQGYNLTWFTSSSELCWSCHTYNVYSGTATNGALSRIDHANLCNDNPYADWSSFGTACMLCHSGSWYTGTVWGSAGNNLNVRNNYGGIHGTWGTYQYASGGTGITKYRFFPGTHMKGIPGAAGINGDTAWNTGGLQWNCYFPSVKTDAYNSCNQHNGGPDTSRIGVSGYSRPTRY